MQGPGVFSRDPPHREAEEPPQRGLGNPKPFPGFLLAAGTPAPRAAPQHLRSVPGASPLHPRSIPAPFPEHPRSIPAPFPLHPRSVPEASPLRSRSIPAPFPEHPRSIPAPFPEHPRSVPALSSLHPRSIPALSPLYPGSIPVLSRLHPGSIPAPSWFYPGSIPVLSRFYPGSIPVLSRFHPGSIPVLSRFYPGSIPVLSRLHPGSIPALSRFYPGSIPALSRFYPGSIPAPLHPRRSRSLLGPAPRSPPRAVIGCRGAGGVSGGPVLKVPWPPAKRGRGRAGAQCEPSGHRARPRHGSYPFSAPAPPQRPPQVRIASLPPSLPEERRRCAARALSRYPRDKAAAARGSEKRGNSCVSHGAILSAENNSIGLEVRTDAPLHPFASFSPVVSCTEGGQKRRVSALALSVRDG
ncbi:inward rectifier potassium channel 2 isoform X2 [Poecile atricapillus]|uniref:inward rectifier potassium channel 2 isoform X2 n=1 Tax=Poecile atricapillus TaxID=48891 RepID=UPI0027384826|nr:inward rectifier potassium channel 2 isoform X2 [Poecile atricapillus]